MKAMHEFEFIRNVLAVNTTISYLCVICSILPNRKTLLANEMFIEYGEMNDSNAFRLINLMTNSNGHSNLFNLELTV